jgi:hypothetical protein
MVTFQSLGILKILYTPCATTIIQEFSRGKAKTFQAILEEVKIQNEIYTEMRKFIRISSLKKTPGHKPKDMDIHLWKLYPKAYCNNKTGDWTQPIRCPLRNRCCCPAHLTLISCADYIRLEFSCTHDENSHA